MSNASTSVAYKCDHMYAVCNVDEMHITVCFLTMVGRGVCYKAPPQGQVFLQSHISSPGLLRLYGGLHIQ